MEAGDDLLVVVAPHNRLQHSLPVLTDHVDFVAPIEEAIGVSIKERKGFLICVRALALGLGGTDACCCVRTQDH
jgi:hypothetical protein